MERKYCNYNNYIGLYYKSLRVKCSFNRVFCAILMLWILPRGKQIAIPLIISIVIIECISHMRPNLLKKETDDAINNFNKSIYDEYNANYYICNVRKFDGPTFGILCIDKESIAFKPFKENIQDEKFTIKIREISNLKIYKVNIKRSIIELLFFKKLTNGICINYDNKKILVHTSDDDGIVTRFKKECKLMIDILQNTNTT